MRPTGRPDQKGTLYGKWILPHGGDEKNNRFARKREKAVPLLFLLSLSLSPRKSRFWEAAELEKGNVREYKWNYEIEIGAVRSNLLRTVGGVRSCRGPRPRCDVARRLDGPPRSGCGPPHNCSGSYKPEGYYGHLGGYRAPTSGKSSGSNFQILKCRYGWFRSGIRRLDLTL